jgi:hypothetical protein
MALKDILSNIAADGGIDLVNSDQLMFTTRKINDAAKELYEENDLVGSLREQVRDVDVPQGNMISLPYYVGKVRAVRYYSPQLNLKIRSMAPRYTAKFWQSKDFLSWEIKGDRALSTDIVNASILTATFQKPVTSLVNVTFIGTTPTANQAIETLTFQPGDSTHSTINQFLDISAITKDSMTASNVVITDVDNRPISGIANNQPKALFQIVQIVNMPNNLNGTGGTFQPASTYVEVLWKLRFKEFATPATIAQATDEFICPNYDQAIYWKYKENRILLSSDATVFSANQAKEYKAKCDQIVKNISQDTSSSMEMSMNFGENPVLDAFANIMLNQQYPGYPLGFPYSFNNLVWP